MAKTKGLLSGGAEMAMPEEPKKMKPMLTVDLEDYPSFGDVEIDDEIKLAVTVKVTGINKDRYSEEKPTRLELEVQSIKKNERSKYQTMADEEDEKE